MIGFTLLGLMFWFPICWLGNHRASESMKDLQGLEPEDGVFSCCQCRRLQRRRRIIIVYSSECPIESHMLFPMLQTTEENDSGKMFRTNPNAGPGQSVQDHTLCIPVLLRIFCGISAARKILWLIQSPPYLLYYSIYDIYINIFNMYI